MTIDVPRESPQGNILNYSIVSSDEDENPLVLKIRLSDKNKVPQVVLRKLEDVEQDVISSPTNSSRPQRIKKLEDSKMKLSGRRKNATVRSSEPSTPRKRGRSKQTTVDEADVEMPSPTKIPKPPRTPRKRSDVDINLDTLCVTIADRVKLTTPVKRSLNSDNKGNDVSPKKREVTVKSTVETPRRRGLRKLDSPMKVDENDVRMIIDLTTQYSPHQSVKVNLNESFRRTVLKSRHNVENLTEGSNIETRESRVRTRKSTSKSYVQNGFVSDEDEAIQVAEALKKSEIEISASRRTLRKRSNSTASNMSAVSLSDCDSISEDTSLKNQKIRRSRKNSTMSISSQNTEGSPDRVALKETVPRTPKTPRNRRQIIMTPKSVQKTPKTPKNRLKLLRDGIITPSMHSRKSIVPGDSTPLMKARSQLHVSYVPSSLPCREKEFLDVYNFLRSKLEDGYGGCMYISGVPGTGKTATVTSVIDNLLKDKKVPKFNFVSVNGMRLTEPRQSYVEIWKQLTGKTVPWEQAQSLLEERFTKKKNLRPVVVLIDELDILCTKRQDVVYNLLDWPTKCKDQLIVITIANTMDLPERLLMSRVTSRLGLTRLTFQAYTHKQLMEIVTKRLIGTNSFNSDAIQLVARKVASVSGDARRALDICRRAAEIAEEDGKEQLVNIMHINQALTAMITQPQVTAIRRCSRLQKLLLQAIVAEIERTGVEETNFGDTFRMLVSCCALDGFKMVSSTAAQRALSQLSACKLILTDQKCSDINQRVVLNVSVHDVYFALKKD